MLEHIPVVTRCQQPVRFSEAVARRAQSVQTIGLRRSAERAPWRGGG
jgi:hypothetical protein